MNHINFETVEQTVKAMKDDPNLAMKQWIANVSWNNGVQNELTIREFNPIMVDEPQPLGGTDIAPNPVEYLVGAAASCFAITFEVIASQKGIALETVNVKMEADLNAAVFLGLQEGDGGILNPKLTLNTKTSASEKEIKEIAEVALSKSPVLLSLNTKIELTIE
ncbi:OsmC family protein [Anaerovorax sp. IOR16]|uniref:OsmC family protein n=1 Tax=Anaerovorax sp. IOR16 TaxID=2773458 RepID=UPI0019D0D2B8|nr:OsmC family protein [Anaerovorax sp. IOR16]